MNVKWLSAFKVAPENKPPEELQIADTSVTFPQCPHCGGELSLLLQTKVYLGEGGPDEETDHV